MQRSEERIKFTLDKMPAKRISITAGNTRRHRETTKTQAKISLNQSLDHKGTTTIIKITYIIVSKEVESPSPTDLQP